MHVSAQMALLAAIALGCTTPGQAQGACSPPALAEAAESVAAVRHTLHEQGVGEQDPAVPPAIAVELGDLKDRLAQAADAAFACAPRSADAAGMQGILAEALHANLPPGSEAISMSEDRRDVGSYGADLAVQVFQLADTPKLLEVDFRYGIECGDDNLLLIYKAGADASHSGWQQRLRWDAAGYKTVADALGDFVVLAPMTGDPKHPQWRFLVAHGHPGCVSMPRPTHFDLDLLTPGAQTTKPTVAWHFERPYTETETSHPRLATTEDTIDFRMQSSAPAQVKAPQGEEVFRFRLAGNGQIEPLPAEGSQGGQPTGATANSPR